jgi:hypothetical protein
MRKNLVDVSKNILSITTEKHVTIRNVIRNRPRRIGECSVKSSEQFDAFI